MCCWSDCCVFRLSSVALSDANQHVVKATHRCNVDYIALHKCKTEFIMGLFVYLVKRASFGNCTLYCTVNKTRTISTS